MSDEVWYISSAKSGEVAGPMSGAALLDQIRSGTAGGEDLIWRDGMSEWQKLELFTWLLLPDAGKQ